jgi:uncharacterized protein (DUF885 family)
MLRIHRFLAGLVLCAASCGGRAPASASAPAPPAGAAFARLVDDSFDSSNRYSPSTAVASGLHEFDAQIEDRSRARILARVAELHALLDRLGRIDRAALGFDDAIDAEATEHGLRGELFALDTLRNWERNPMDYAGLPGGALDVVMKRDFAPGKERLRALIARLRGVPAIFAAGKANVQNPPKEFTDLAIIMARGSIDFLEHSVPEWAARAADGDQELLAELARANDAALAANRDFLAWLEHDLAPRSRGSYALGAARFLEELRLEEMVDMPLDQLLAKGEAQLAKDHAAFLETARQIDPRVPPERALSLLDAEHPTADDLLPAVARSVEAARRFVVERDLVTIPSEVRPRIAETPPYNRGASSASMDTPGAFETRATEAFYYVTPVEKDWDAEHKEEHLRGFANAIIAVTNVHEAFPGHYVQFLYMPRVATKTRKIVTVGTNVEGWAHYAEQMLVDAGFGGGDPRIRLAQLEEALLRDCRYVVGIKLHTQGMTVEEGKKLFVEQCFQQPANAFMEARRGTFNPTYLYYTLGKLEIQELRDQYVKQKGATLKQFHDAFLAQGGLPLPLVRRLLLR